MTSHENDRDRRAHVAASPAAQPDPVTAGDPARFGARQMAQSQYRMRDTRKAPGTYVTFASRLTDDEHFEPRDAKEQRDVVSGRILALGVQAVATIEVVGTTSACLYTVASAGLGGVTVRSKSDPYLDEVYAEELASLRADLATFSSAKEA